MSWYKTGTIAATNGSKIITGTDTTWANALSGVSAGRMLLLPGSGTVQIYEIESVQSNTQLTLVTAFSGTSGSGKSYAIPTSPSVSIEQFANEFAATLAYYQQQLSGWQQILTGTGNITLTTPDGQSVTVRSQSAWDAALSGKVTGVKQTGPFDPTANALMVNGAWGLGGTLESTTTESSADTVTTGRFLASNETTLGIGGTMGIVMPYTTATNGAYVTRMFFRNNRGFFKTKENGTWGPVCELWSSNVRLINNEVSAATNPFKGVGFYNAGYGNWPVNFGTVFQSYYPSGGGISLMQRAVSSTTAAYQLFGRNIIVDAAGAATYGTPVEFWHSGNLAKQSNALASSGDVLVAGLAGGIGKDFSATLPNATLASDFRANGSWYVQGTQQADVPSNGHLFNIFGHITRNYGAQFWIDHRNASPDFRFRTIDNGTASDWHQIATLDATQTFSGQKTFTAPPIFQNPSQLISIVSPTIAAGTIGRSFDISSNNSGTPRFVFARRINPDNGTGQQFVTLPMPTSGSGTVLISNVNAIADANGFWKSASPVVKLFSDGSSELTSEAEGVTTERISEGVYRISGCLGLNSDAAWGGIDGGISNPKCRNGLERVWNDYAVEADGSIVIRTYHRPHPDAPEFARNEVEGYSNGDPIDIPADVFVSVRVQMPEQEEVKPKVMHSNVYCGNVLPEA